MNRRSRLEVREKLTIYRHELRPVITTSADVTDKIFTAAERER